MAFETKEKKEYNSAILGPIRDYRKKIEGDIIQGAGQQLLQNSRCSRKLGKLLGIYSSMDVIYTVHGKKACLESRKKKEPMEV